MITKTNTGATSINDVSAPIKSSTVERAKVKVNEPTSTTVKNLKPERLPIRQPINVSREALTLQADGKLQYKAPKGKRDFAFEYARNYVSHIHKSRSQVISDAKKAAEAKKTDGKKGVVANQS